MKIVSTTIKKQALITLYKFLEAFGYPRSPLLAPANSDQFDISLRRLEALAQRLRQNDRLPNYDPLPKAKITQ